MKSALNPIKSITKIPSNPTKSPSFLLHRNSVFSSARRAEQLSTSQGMQAVAHPGDSPLWKIPELNGFFHRKITDKWSIFLAMIRYQRVTMEKHHVSWENQLSMDIFSSRLPVITRRYSPSLGFSDNRRSRKWMVYFMQNLSNG